MNEKIFELAEQARELITVRNSEGVALSLNRVKFEQKFAELIIRECLTIMESTSYLDVAISEVKERFGVEE